MIGKLKGIVDHISSNSLILDVSGVGYMVYCSWRFLSALTLGMALDVWIHTQVKEAEVTLYGFIALDEKRCFESLITVQGVGGKVALAILSVLSPEALVQAIVMEDVAAFKAISGIGPKLAARITNELKNNQVIKTFRTNLTSSDSKIYHSNAIVVDEAISALVNLGFNRQSAVDAVQRTITVDAESKTLEDVIKEALGLMS
jgi:holliday junction DNA helicase RuvA